ncbi:MAG: glutaredoxin family protein [Anaerolineae bacterium]
MSEQTNEAPSSLVLFGAVWCPDVLMTRAYLDRQGIAYVYRDIDRDPDAMATLLELRGEAWVVPTLVLANGTVLDNPSRRELARRLGL